MLVAVRVITVIVVSVAMSLALAHALELPGKMRLSKELYVAVQRIYYPGFTIGGVSEPIGLLLTLGLLLITPWRTLAFVLTLVALLGLIGMQLVYWAFIHPVNEVWLQDESLSHLGSGFFSFGKPLANGAQRPTWTQLRNRWEFAHSRGLHWPS